MSLTAAATLASSVAVAGRLIGWLTTGGALSGAVVGAAVLYGAGMQGGALLALFFVSGSLLTHATARRHGDASGQGRHARRASQVIANGGWAAIAALAVPWTEYGWTILAGSLAAAQADTWATEMGTLSGRLPALITTGERVPPGTSGAVSLAGTGGGLLGAAIMAGGAALLARGSVETGAAAFIAGLVGSTVDSILGATVQGKYCGEGCGAVTEDRRHACGRGLRRIRGWPWPDNDGVNLIASGVGGAVAAATVWLSRALP